MELNMNLIYSNLSRINKMLLSVRLRPNLHVIVETLREKERVDWSTWHNRELKDLCEFYIENKFCQRRELELEQYDDFLTAVIMHESWKVQMLHDLVDSSPGMKLFLQLYSSFDDDIENERNWFIKEMYRITNVTKEDEKIINQKEYVPQELLDKLRIFDPEPLGIEKLPLRIEYSKGGRINVIDTCWEKIKGREVDVENFLASFTPISTKPPALQFLQEDDNELPF
jgi:hypothetical protein